MAEPLATGSPSDLPGLDLRRFMGWLSGQVHGLPVDAEPMAELVVGGRSNLTYAVDLGPERWIVRRPPLGHLLDTAHDMAREYRVMAALAGSAVPVPRMVAFCDDPAVLGVPFYVMERISGRAFRTADELAELGPVRARTISVRLVDALLALHAVDPATVGLDGFGRPSGFLARQVRRWQVQLGRSRSRRLPLAERLHGVLLERLPHADQPGRLLHGDFRLDNLLYDGADRPVAVIDWEMATVGDPFTDLALLVVYRRMSELGVNDALADALAAPGCLTASELLDRYLAHTDAVPSDLGFYLGLAAYKLTAIVEGIHVRHQEGGTVGEGFEGVGDLAAPLLTLGLALMAEHR